MGKITWYIAILSITLLLFHFAGLIDNTPISFLLDTLLNPENLKNASIYTQIIGILSGFVAGGAIIIGFFAPTRIEQTATVAFTTFLFTIGWDFIAIFNVIKQSNIHLAILLISPLLIIYILTAIEWWRGKD